MGVQEKPVLSLNGKRVEEDSCLACSNKQKEMDRAYNVTDSPRGLARLRLARAEVIEQSITIIMGGERERDLKKR